MANPQIKQVTLPSGNTYDLVDQGARDLIGQLSGATKFLGVTTTALTDDATTNPIKINNKDITATTGDIASYGSKEFIFNGTSWQEFGDLSALGTLAYKNSVAVSTKASGTVSKPTFTGSATTSTGKFTPSGSVTVSTNATTNKTATVSAASSGTATYTPSGTVSQPTFTGSATTSLGDYTPAGKNTGGAVTLNTTTVNSITDVGTLPTFTVANEVLTITAGTLPTKGANTTVATSVKSVTQPTFTGTKATISVSGTPSGTVSQPSFTGTGARLVTDSIAVPNTYTATFTGTEGDVSVSGTPSGTVSQPTFTGNNVAGTVTYTP